MIDDYLICNTGCPETLLLDMSKLVWSVLTAVKQKDPLSSEVITWWNYLFLFSNISRNIIWRIAILSSPRLVLEFVAIPVIVYFGAALLWHMYLGFESVPLNLFYLDLVGTFFFVLYLQFQLIRIMFSPIHWNGDATFLCLFSQYKEIVVFSFLFFLKSSGPWQCTVNGRSRTFTSFIVWCLDVSEGD